MKFIIGLGNPGRKYIKTRHNIGWLVLDEMIGKERWKENDKLPGFYFKKEINGQEVKLIKPTTFMNLSGKVIRFLKKKHPQTEIEDFIIIHDDKDLEFGRIKAERGRGSAGHKGVESVTESLGSKNFWRIRIGVKNNLLEKMSTDSFVLSKFSRAERKELENIISEAVHVVEEVI